MVTQNTFSVGDRVRFTWGFTPVQGVVVEDRGPLGRNKRRIFGVRFCLEPDDESVIELPEDELVLSEDRPEPIPSSNIVAYLKNSGLTRILRSNLTGAGRRPRAWLKADAAGNVTHTFIEEWGEVGGAAVPSSALHDRKIFDPKADEVFHFLLTFGLSKEEAKQVVESVGVSS